MMNRRGERVSSWNVSIWFKKVNNEFEFDRELSVYSIWIPEEISQVIGFLNNDSQQQLRLAYNRSSHDVAVCTAASIDGKPNSQNDGWNVVVNWLTSTKIVAFTSTPAPAYLMMRLLDEAMEANFTHTDEIWDHLEESAESYLMNPEAALTELSRSKPPQKMLQIVTNKNFMGGNPLEKVMPMAATIAAKLRDGSKIDPEPHAEVCQDERQVDAYFQLKPVTQGTSEPAKEATMTLEKTNWTHILNKVRQKTSIVLVNSSLLDTAKHYLSAMAVILEPAELYLRDLDTGSHVILATTDVSPSEWTSYILRQFQKWKKKEHSLMDTFSIDVDVIGCAQAPRFVRWIWESHENKLKQLYTELYALAQGHRRENVSLPSISRPIALAPVLSAKTLEHLQQQLKDGDVFHEKAPEATEDDYNDYLY